MPQRGISLIELIMFIVIISVSLVGILLVMNQVTSHSADPLVRKQALAIGESLLEEIKLQDLSGSTCVGTLTQDLDRTGATSVCDYNNYSTSAGIREFSSNKKVPGLDGYKIASVTIDNNLGTFGGMAITQGSGVQITVKVEDPTGAVTEVTGYRAGR
jgi:MSHA pilin protein MshD